MRLLLTAILGLLILGGTWAYIRLDNSIKREASQVLYAKAEGKTTVQIDRTFECFGDPDFDEPAISVMFGGNNVFASESESIPPDQPIEFELAEVEQEGNTLTVFANAESPDSFGDDGPPLRAMLVRVFYDDELLAEEMFHADGSSISLGGDISFEVPGAEKESQ